MDFSKPTYNFMLLGKTGDGKSSTGNTLINREKAFKASNQPGSCTQIPKLECGSSKKYNIKVVDTPGLQDTKVDMAVTLNYICLAMALLPDGFDALLLVMRYGDRCTRDFIEVITALRTSFGEVFAKMYCIIAMTHGDNFETDMSEEDCPGTFDDYCKKIREPPELLCLLEECDYKVVLFNNKNKDKREETMDRLLQLVKTIKHRSNRYTEDIFAKCATARNKYVISLKLPQLIPAIQEKLSFLKEELEKSIDNPDAKSDFEIKRKAQQLLDTIAAESGGTSLMDGLKNEARRIISTVHALTSQKEKRLHMLQEINSLVETIKNPPSLTSVILSGLAAGILGVNSGIFTVATLIHPICAVPARAYFAGAKTWAKICSKELTTYKEEKRHRERALKRIDELKNDL